MSLPDFLCIGAQKAGTSWLYNMLRQNPEIWLGPFKEVQYFNSVFVQQHRQWTPWHVKNSVRNALAYHVKHEPKLNLQYLHYITSLTIDADMFKEDWYRLFFSRKGSQVAGDITPEYCTLPPEGIDYLLRLLGPIPVIYIVRDPVSRALSQLRMNMDRRGISEAEKDIDWDGLINDWDIMNRGDYISNISRWMARYPNDRLKFVPYKRVSADPVPLLNEIDDHIGVSRHIYSSAEQKVFEGKKIKLPEHVQEKMQKRMAPQLTFLSDTFDESFVSML